LIAYPRLGVLGGMGPLATVDFMQKLILATPTQTDQEHMPVIAYNVPQIPDRTDAFLSGSDEPWAYLLAGLKTLEQAGASAIAMPCNTAHVWYERLCAETDALFFHIGQAACTQALQLPGRGVRRVGMLATSATLAAGIYHRDLVSRDARVVEPGDEVQDRCVMPGIRAVKAGRIDEGRALLTEAARHLETLDIDSLILGCTEIPIALKDVDLTTDTIDATDALASTCVAWWYSTRTPDAATTKHRRFV